MYIREYFLFSSTVYVGEREILTQNVFSFMQWSLFTFVYFSK